jgi:hypothetical protein
MEWRIPAQIIAPKSDGGHQPVILRSIACSSDRDPRKGEAKGISERLLPAVAMDRFGSGRVEPVRMWVSPVESSCQF